MTKRKQAKHELSVTAFGVNWDVAFHVYKTPAIVRRESHRILGHKEFDPSSIHICNTNRVQKTVDLCFSKENVGSGLVAHEILHAVDRMTPEEVFITMAADEYGTAIGSCYFNNVYEHRAELMEYLTIEFWRWWYDR